MNWTALPLFNDDTHPPGYIGCLSIMTDEVQRPFLDIKVHKSCVNIIYTLEALSSLTQITHNLQVTINLLWKRNKTKQNTEKTWGHPSSWLVIGIFVNRLLFRSTTKITSLFGVPESLCGQVDTKMIRTKRGSVVERVLMGVISTRFHCCVTIIVQS